MGNLHSGALARLISFAGLIPLIPPFSASFRAFLVPGRPVIRVDIAKVPVERPRWGASHAVSPNLKRNPHPDTHHIGLKRHAHIGAAGSKGGVR